MEDVQQSPKVRYTLQPRVKLVDSWDAQTRVIGKTDPLFMFYLFGSGPNCIFNRGDVLKTSNNTVKFTEVNSPGSYTIYGVTGWYIDDYPGVSNSTITLETPLSLLPKGSDISKNARDICLGKTIFEVNPLQVNYDVTVTVEHIMAKAAFEINNVPKDVSEMQVVLPNQASTFTFNGTISGENNSQTLEMTKANNANSDGTFNWTLTESLVYPYANDSGTMPIHVIATTDKGTLKFETQSTQPCSSGKRILYKSNWQTIIYTQSTQVEFKNWTEKIINNDFNLSKK